MLSLFFDSLAQKSNNNEHPIKISIELPDTIYVGQRNILIILKIENTTSEVLSIRNPKEWGTYFISLKQKELRKINSIIVDYVITIKEHETLRINLGTLDGSYSLDIHSLGKHEIYFKYYYEPEKKSKMISFMKRFKKKDGPKFVTTEVFTFYIRQKRENDDFPDLLRHIR